MTPAEIAARLIEALEAEATRNAAAPTALLSASVEMLGAPTHGDPIASVTRKTKTLLFSSAEYHSGGERIATASGVHKILS